MKVVSSKQMAFLESQAYRNGSSEREFMEEAGKGIARVLDCYVMEHHLSRHLFLMCGKGNNAGDAYVAGTYLLDQGYTVLAYQIVPINDCSPLCQDNHARFLSKGGQQVDGETFPCKGVIVDAIFGTGFHGIAKEPYAGAIKKANQSSLPVIAIDIPSGLEGDTGVAEGDVIKAALTIFLGLPKIGFFLEEGWNHVGKLQHVDFGLPHQYVAAFDARLIMESLDSVAPLFPKIVSSRHKYQAGYAVGLAGSPGMPGAAILSSIATLKTGAGIVRLLHPSGMEAELSASPYELIKTAYTLDEVERVLEMMNAASATFIGPGIGRTPQMRNFLKKILLHLEKPCVIDADALTIIAEEEMTLPEQAVLTPHIGEMMRLLHLSPPKPSTSQLLERCQTFVDKYRITLVLKGGPSFIFHPGATIRVNPHGDPGMATAGSGDVLTGMVAALLAQGLSPHHAAIAAVYLHSIAGEYAANENTSYCMVASDIIAHLPHAFKDLLGFVA